MNIYFEIADSLVDKAGGKYLAMYGINQPAMSYIITSGQERLTIYANRIWEETEDGVVFTKHRFDPCAQVDMKEFFWIKLQCQSL